RRGPALRLTGDVLVDAVVELDLRLRIEHVPDAQVDAKLRPRCRRGRHVQLQLTRSGLNRHLAEAPQEVRQTVRVARVVEAKLHGGRRYRASHATIRRGSPERGTGRPSV